MIIPVIVILVACILPSYSSFESEGGKVHFLSIIVTIKDELNSIFEFVQHYLEEGVDHFYIYDDDSVDDTVQALTCIPNRLYSLYTKSDIHHTKEFNFNKHNNSGQLDVYSQIYDRLGARDNSEWVIVVDVDELITSRSHPHLPIRSVLEQHLSHCDIISVPWILYSWGKHTRTPINTARYHMSYRWGFGPEYFKVNAVGGKFGNIEGGIQNKVIVRTEAVKRLHYIHEADFYDTATGVTANRTLCIPSSQQRLECAQRAIEKHKNWYPKTPPTTYFNTFHQHGMFYLPGAHFFLPINCPMANQMLAPMSTFKTDILEPDVPNMLLANFHYRVKSKEDFDRLLDPSRHSSIFYQTFRNHIDLVNRMDVFDPFMEEVRLPARQADPFFISASAMKNACGEKYFH